MDPPQGTDGDEGCSGWCFVDLEAQEDGVDDNDNDDESVDEEDYAIVNLFDDEDVTQGNSLTVYEAQNRADDERAVQKLKRKLLQSPELDLSPRLSAITIGKKSGKAKRRLFMPGQDSGYGQSVEANVEESVLQTQVSLNFNGEDSGGGGGAPCTVSGAQETPETMIQLLKQANPQAAMMGLFKKTMGISFTDLSRTFQSDKTPCVDWVAVCFGVPLSLIDACTELLQPHCEFGNVTTTPCCTGYLLLLLARFQVAKCRVTVKKLLGNTLHVPEQQILTEPPKIRCPAAAIYWYKKGITGVAKTWGPLPEWLAKMVNVSSNLADAAVFNLSDMIQWAYDNNKTEDADIAYGYAQLADTDRNAEAFLKSNSQAKYVKDCGVMVRLYKKAEMQRTSMKDWIKRRCEEVDGDGDWRPIVSFLKFQGIDMAVFISVLKNFLKGIPKQNCIVICGPPNTGKSLFSVSLIQFLSGKVISFVNSKSHFWLQPLGECKVALLDDATGPAWDYFDTFLRNLVDGNPISLDCKHKAPTQVKCPPLIITSNIDVTASDRWKYLHSRLKLFTFSNPCPLTEQGEPAFNLTPVNWKCFFKRLKTRLGLADDEGEDHGESQQPLKCTARGTDGFV
ncbi:E1 protein [Phocoena phocoena papillomavirus 4]|uniref:Replication protein E1 n=1 Tax=Phocoena phocoena papillomavirus 4 TaxID=706527 RepID=F2VIS1_9PAPI|nr:E1 protein [Phocoena phocoena papillomavirus 4]ADJ96354.1 E1 protein [Phocoena phocoena papillomavirus 4]